MKRIYRSLLLISLFILLGAPNIYFDILVPATVDLPSGIKSVAIIDRSISENEIVNVLEKGLFSALSGKADRLSKNCVNGLYDQLNSQNRVKPVITGIVEKRPGLAIDFPDPMHWFEIDSICRAHSTDAVISLEIFNRQLIENVAKVKVGIRIYDPASKLIIDEFLYFHSLGRTGPPSGGDAGQVVINALNNDDALKKASYISGTIYGKRVSPFWIRVQRDYFKRSKRDPKMAEGARMMEVNNWDAAIEAFQLAIEHGHRKTKGRASHNLAIVYEITGDLDLAFETAQEAWGKYRNKKSQEYSLILQDRRREMNILRMQEER